MRACRPSWGVLNITGPLLAWSFTDTLPTAPIPVRLLPFKLSANFKVACVSVCPENQFGMMLFHGHEAV